MKEQLMDGVQLTGEIQPNYAEILKPKTVQFLASLHRKFNPVRKSLLKQRIERQYLLNHGKLPSFLPETASIRNDSSWKVASSPSDLEKRWVEITGPTDKKMMINALNSKADVYMADFEDANSPSWANIIQGQANLQEAINGTLAFTSSEGKRYTLNEQVAVLMVRPRGWHLVEKHILIDGEPISASLFDFGVFFFNQAQRLIAKGSGPYFYLPKLENHLEARLWNDVFLFAQNELEIPKGTIRATVLIETILAAFEMEEILFELRDHCVGLNAGRWDYIFSIIKKFHQADFVFPDRSQITMTVPFMRAYTDLLVQTCHKRGTHAIGGMAAFIPSRKDKKVNENALLKVEEDKFREVRDGFDGTWVAHPDLVPIAHEAFSKGLGERKQQKDRLRKDVKVNPSDLINFNIPGGRITEAGLRQNISVALQYLEAWLRGTGAVAIFNLMEDTATAEISRAQVWQWIHQCDVILENGLKISAELVKKIIEEELIKIKIAIGETNFNTGQFTIAKQIFENLVNEESFVDFLTFLTHDYLD